MRKLKRFKYYYLLGLYVIIMSMTSCYRVVVKVDTIPGNTPKGDPLYITGNFNNWDPGDEKYRMTLQPDSTYIVALPNGFGEIEYKFTRGDWRAVEKDICGYDISNRRLVLGEEDTVTNIIQSWNDQQPLNCPRVTIVVKSLPENTPADASIAIAGNFNSWIPDAGSFLQKDSAGNYYITLDKQQGIDEVDYKITRGNLSTSETDIYGNDIPVRKLHFGERDTVQVIIQNWKDLALMTPHRVTVILTNIPENTPPGADIYLVSNLNGWDPGDRNYLMMKNADGTYSISIPIQEKTMEFKFTRGDWSTVEADSYGFDILNRTLDLSEPVKEQLTIANWKDLTREKKDQITIILTNLPEQTPKDARIYITGNLNNWDAGERDYELIKTATGEYSIRLPRRWGSLEFKFTRGSWQKVEIDRYGNDVQNRIYQYKDIDTLFLSVDNWKDIGGSEGAGVTMILRNMPQNTPAGDNFYLAADLNNWQPGNSKYKFRKDENGQFSLTIPRHGASMEYKITRGSWRTVEVEENGSEKPNRGFTFGFSDTLYIDVLKWRDMGGTY
jgi:hypothetical protein